MEGVEAVGTPEAEEGLVEEDSWDDHSLVGTALT